MNEFLLHATCTVQSLCAKTLRMLNSYQEVGRTTADLNIFLCDIPALTYQATLNRRVLGRIIPSGYRFILLTESTVSGGNESCLIIMEMAMAVWSPRWMVSYTLACRPASYSDCNRSDHQSTEAQHWLKSKQHPDTCGMCYCCV